MGVPTLKKSTDLYKTLFLDRRGHRLDLNQEPVVKRANRNHGARRTMISENSRVDFIDCFPQIYIGDVNSHFEHAVPAATRRL
jgi:hypothetical protein